MDKKQTAVIYSRVSTLQQDNESAINDLLNIATQNNYEVVKIFEEIISGKTKAQEREEFKKLLLFIDENGVDHLMIWELSRLGRNLINILEVIRELKDKRINVFIKKDGINTLNPDGTENTTGSLLISILGTLAQMELKQMEERSKRGLRESASKGGRTGIIVPYGYKMENKVMVIDEEEAEVVKMIFTKYLQGMGLQVLADYLNNQNIPTKYNKIFKKPVKTKFGIVKEGKDFTWKDGTLYSLVTNSLYYGKRKYKNDIFDVPKIIEKEIFDQVQERLRSNYNKKDNNRQYLNIFKERIKCGVCGLNYFMHKRKDRSDNAYKCLSTHYRQQCGNGGISIDKLNNSIYLLLNSYISLYHNINEDKILQLEKERENLNIELNNAYKSIELGKRKMKNLLEIRLNGKIDIEMYSESYDEITKESIKNEKQVNQLNIQINDKNELINNLKYTKVEDIVNDVKLFKQYANKLIDKIVVLQLQDLGELNQIYKVKGDVAFYCIVEAINVGHSFIISRRSDSMLLEIMGDNIDFDNKKFTGTLKSFSKLKIPNVINVDGQLE